MEVTLHETDGHFWIELDAEPISDSAQILRITKSIKLPVEANAYFDKSEVHGSIAIPLRKEKSRSISNRIK